MYAPQSLHDCLFLLLYGGVTMLALLAGLYLALRRNNGICAGVTPPTALRRWTAAFLVMTAFSHVWWYILGVYWLSNDRLVRNIVAVTLDHLLLVPLVMVLLLLMLQDRRRRLWPWVLTQVPIAVSATVGIATHDAFYGFGLPTYWQVGVMVLFLLYYIRALLQYGRWLRDNYADLEHKEVWQSLLFVVALFLIYESYFTNPGEMAREYLAQFFTVCIVVFLVWRVENLQQLDDSEDCADEAPIDDPIVDRQPIEDAEPAVTEMPAKNSFFTLPIPPNIGVLLSQYCEGSKLYLHHNLTLAQLSEHIGTNRTYLSAYFAQQGITYNSYINGLRIDYFEHLFLNAVASDHPFTAKQLAYKCGFSSYSTFATAFKLFKGQSVATWMKEHIPLIEEE